MLLLFTWILFRRCCSAVFIIPSYFSQPHVLQCPIYESRPLLFPAQSPLASQKRPRHRADDQAAFTALRFRSNTQTASQKNRAARFGVSRCVFIFTASNAVPVPRPRKPKKVVTTRVRITANSRRAADRP